MFRLLDFQMNLTFDWHRKTVSSVHFLSSKFGRTLEVFCRIIHSFIGLPLTFCEKLTSFGQFFFKFQCKTYDLKVKRRLMKLLIKVRRSRKNTDFRFLGDLVLSCFYSLICCINLNGSVLCQHFPSKRRKNDNSKM